MIARCGLNMATKNANDGLSMHGRRLRTRNDADMLQADARAGYPSAHDTNGSVDTAFLQKK